MFVVKDAIMLLENDRPYYELNLPELKRLYNRHYMDVIVKEIETYLTDNNINDIKVIKLFNDYEKRNRVTGVRLQYKQKEEK